MILDVSVQIAFILLSMAFICALIRFLLGPDLTDRVVALDLIAMIISAFVVVYMLDAGQPLLLDVVVVTALITFFGTVAFARYLEKGMAK
jgi:multicomponent Na+:H+ antiporter subunit F